MNSSKDVALGDKHLLPASSGAAGGNRGLGLDVARKLVDSGSRVILTSRNTAAGDAADEASILLSLSQASPCRASCSPIDSRCKQGASSPLPHPAAGCILRGEYSAAGQCDRQGLPWPSRHSRQQCWVSVCCSLPVVGWTGKDAIPHLPASVYPDGWSEAVWDSTLRTNLLGPVRMTEALLPHLPDGTV